MDPSISVQLLWPLAAEEAIAGGFKHIEPMHVFLALLKFAEVDSVQLAEVIQDKAAAQAVTAELNSVKEGFGQWGIAVPKESTTLRRELRQRMGYGGFSGEARRVVSRSSASREICNAAEEHARRKSASYVWDLNDLLVVILERLESEIQPFLPDDDQRQRKASVDCPTLAAYCIPVTPKVADEVRPLSLTDPVAKVVLDELAGSKRRNVLLIQAGQRDVTDIMESIARCAAIVTPSTRLKQKRILELSLERIAKQSKSLEATQSILTDIFREATQADRIILWLSAFHRFWSVGNGMLLEPLRAEFGAQHVPIIAMTNQSSYERDIRPSPEWQKLLRPIWVHDLNIPTKV